MFNIKEKNIDLGDGRIITLETGRMARQADGSVLLKMGKTMLLATVMAAKEAKEDTDFDQVRSNPEFAAIVSKF